MCINIICAVDVDKKILLFVIFGLNYIDIVFGSVRELYYLLLFDIVSFPICIFVFVWSEKRPQNIVWSVLVTKKSTFAHACTEVCFLLSEHMFHLEPSCPPEESCLCPHRLDLQVSSKHILVLLSQTHLLI